MYENERIIVQNPGIDPGYAALLANNNNDLATMMAAMNGNGGFGGGNGAWWIIIIIVLFAFGGWGGRGNYGNDGGHVGVDYAAITSLASQFNTDNNTDLLMQAIEGNGVAINNLATTLNCDVTALQNAVCAVKSGIDQVGCDVKFSSAQVINSIQAGNADLASRLAECCCNTQRSIDGVNLNLTKMSYEDRLAMCEQTNTLTSAIRNDGDSTRREIAEFRRAWESKNYNDLLANNTRLQTVLDLRDQQAAFQACTNNAVAPIINTINHINQEVTELRDHQLPTYPQQYMPGYPVTPVYAYGAAGISGYNDYNCGCGC